MVSKPSSTCSQHKKEKVWQQTVFEYGEESVSVQVQNAWAWVCPEDGEPSFTPERVNVLIVTTRELVDIAECAKK